MSTRNLIVLSLKKSEKENNAKLNLVGLPVSHEEHVFVDVLLDAESFVLDFGS